MKGWLLLAGILSLQLSSAQMVWFPKDQPLQLDSSFKAHSHNWRIKAKRAVSHIKGSSFGPYRVEEIRKGKATFVDARKEPELFWKTRISEFMREGTLVVSDQSRQTFTIAFRQKEVKKQTGKSLLGNMISRNDNDEEYSSYTITYPAFLHPSDSSFWVSSFGNVGTLFSIQLPPYYFTNGKDTIHIEVQLRRETKNALFPEIKAADIAGIVLLRNGHPVGALELRREKFAPNDYAWVSQRLTSTEGLMVAGLVAYLYGCLDTTTTAPPDIR